MKKILTTLLGLAAPALLLAQGWPAGYGGVMLQGFYWDSYTDTKWTTLERQADDLAASFDLIWIPQSAYCGGKSMGYDDLYWFTNYNSSFGTEAQLRSMISTFKSKGLGTIADVVVNHRKTLGSWVDFPKETYKGVDYQLLSTDITSNDDGGETAKHTGGKSLSSNRDTGEDWGGMRDLDHMSANVQSNVAAYLDLLLNDLGYTGFRYDMVKGYAARFTGKYNAAAKPQFSVGECWDSSSTIASWIANTASGEGANDQIQSAAFDFQFRYTVRNAAHSHNWAQLTASNGGDGNWPLVSNMPTGKDISYLKNNAYRRYAVTFVENHDTERRAGAEQDPLKSDTLAANAYMLAMPGTPCVFLKHWQAYKKDIASMIAVRKAVGITNTSTYAVSRATADYYIGNTTGTKGRLVVLLGDTEAMTPSKSTWVEVLSGYHYKYFMERSIETAWADVATGEYKQAFDVTLTAVSSDDAAQLVYTTDGSTPTATNGTRVTSGTRIAIGQAMTLNVGLLKNGQVSGIVTRTYSFEGGEPRPPFEPYDINIHVKDPGWQNLNFWCWVEGSDNLCDKAYQSWPGDPIVKDGILQPLGKVKQVADATFYYKTYTVKDYDYDIMFIFSNAGSPQTVNLGPFSKDVYLQLSESQPGGNLVVDDVTAIYGSNAVADLNADSPVTSVRYVDVAGRVSPTPFQGMNIVISRHADGHISTAKIIK